MTTPALLFDLDDVPELLRPLLEVATPEAILPRLDAFAASLEPAIHGRVHPSAVLEGPVWLAEGAEIGPGAYLQGPIWIGPGAMIGDAAYLRGPVVVADEAKVLHASEVKRSLLLRGARVPHFNYVGDSVLGARVNLGAGVKLANYKADGGEIRIDGRASGTNKLGAILGDDVSIGCNAVLNPGTLVGRGSLIYAGAVVRGSVPARTLVKVRPAIESTPLDRPG